MREQYIIANAGPSYSPRSLLLGLPQEVIDLIILNICRDSPESVIHLSLTCVYFFRLLGLEFQRALAEDSAPWAGNRLVFVGDHAKGLDVGGICTGDEIRQFEEDKEKYNDNPLYHMAENRVMCTVLLQCRREGDDVRQAGTLEHRIREKLTLNDVQLFNQLAAIAKRPQLSTDDHEQNAPVLRNLTAKKYVRDDALANYAYGLSEVAAVFASWTQDGSGLPDLDGQGEWAGHRVDIATMADVSDEGWTDVSELAVWTMRTGRVYIKKMRRRA